MVKSRRRGSYGGWRVGWTLLSSSANASNTLEYFSASIYCIFCWCRSVYDVTRNVILGDISPWNW